MRISLPYHRSAMEAELSDNCPVGIYRSQLPEPHLPEAELVRMALDAPIASERLEKLAAGKKNALIITSDHTRPVPSRIIMPQILERLRRGEPDIRITILVATGFHRATTRKELTEKLGAGITASERIVIHDATDPAMLADAGRLPSGGRFSVNKLALESDLVIAEGFIEPHFFAGFSGGRKSVLPGIASRETILANHCSEFIQSPFARTGNLENNPLHHDMLYAARQVKLAFIVNVIINHDKRIIHAVAGDCEAAHLAGCDWLKKRCRISVPPADIVITSNGGYPLDQNVYQAVKGMTAGEAVCRPGGVIIMVSACADGHGGESFYDHLASASTPRAVLKEVLQIPRDKTEPDQWEFQILARILDNHTVILVTRDCDHAMLRAMHLHTASTLEEALAAAHQIAGASARIAVIPDGVSVIAEIEK